MQAVELSQQQRARMAELPEDYRVVGVARTAPLVRKPSGQIIRIQQNGRVTTATTAARRRLAAWSPRALGRVEHVIRGSSVTICPGCPGAPRRGPRAPAGRSRPARDRPSGDRLGPRAAATMSLESPPRAEIS